MDMLEAFVIMQCINMLQGLIPPKVKLQLFGIPIHGTDGSQTAHIHVRRGKFILPKLGKRSFESCTDLRETPNTCNVRCEMITA